MRVTNLCNDRLRVILPHVSGSDVVDFANSLQKACRVEYRPIAATHEVAGRDGPHGERPTPPVGAGGNRTATAEDNCALNSLSLPLWGFRAGRQLCQMLHACNVPHVNVPRMCDRMSCLPTHK